MKIKMSNRNNGRKRYDSYYLIVHEWIDLHKTTKMSSSDSAFLNFHLHIVKWDFHRLSHNVRCSVIISGLYTGFSAALISNDLHEDIAVASTAASKKLAARIGLYK